MKAKRNPDSIVAHPCTWYVDTNAKEDGDGTQERPFKCWDSHNARLVRRAGDTIRMIGPSSSWFDFGTPHVESHTGCTVKVGFDPDRDATALEDNAAAFAARLEALNKANGY